jgi:UDP-galactopyranose mutase
MYKQLMNEEKSVIFGGRLADYKYYDMHQVIASALKSSAEEAKVI